MISNRGTKAIYDVKFIESLNRMSLKKIKNMEKGETHNIIEIKSKNTKENKESVSSSNKIEIKIQKDTGNVTSNKAPIKKEEKPLLDPKLAQLQNENIEEQNITGQKNTEGTELIARRNP